MFPEENQNLENTTEENPVSALPKEEIFESVPVLENLEVEKPIEQVEISEPEIAKEVAEEVISPSGEITEDSGSLRKLAKTEVEEIPIIKTVENEQNEAGLPRSVEFAETTEEVEPTKPIQIQEIPVKSEIQIVEKIIYKTDPNLIQNLLNKARAKIQERKRKKLDKIMSLFELNSEISNSNIQNLLRTTKRSATRYLNILEKEQKITQVGNAGRSVKYVKKQ